MENRRDAEALVTQFDLFKNHNEKTKEYLSAIQLLMVDDNNGRVKDPTFSRDIESINNRVNDLNREIDSIMNKMNR